MKFILFAILVLIFVDGFGQDSEFSFDSISYNLYFHFSCENQTQKITEYYLDIRVNDSIIEFIPDSSGTCIIPFDIDSEIELRTTILGWIQTTIDKNTQVFRDTIIVPPIFLAPSTTKFYIGATYYSYYHCGQKCHGLEKAYREDGKLWQRGRFRKGNLKALKTYYSDRILESKVKKRFLNGCDIQYDDSRKLNLRMKYFLFFSSYKVYDKEKKKYIKRFDFGQYK